MAALDTKRQQEKQLIEEEAKIMVTIMDTSNKPNKRYT